MGAIREKMVVKWRMEGEAASHARTDIRIRGLTTKIDEPVQRGGTNLGMSPTETMVAALVGCTNVISHKIAQKNGFELRSMHIAAEVEFDRRGVTLAEEVAVPFPAITLVIDVETAGSEEQMATLRHELSMFCPIAKMVRASGTVLNEVWNVTPLTAKE